MRSAISIVCLVLMSIGGFAQKKSEELKNREQELIKKIQVTKQLIGDTKNNQRLTMAELGIINQQISHRNELLATYQRQIALLEDKISDNESVIVALREDLQKLKDKYARMIYHAYKNRHDYHEMMFIFSSQSVRQAYSRLKYMKKVAEYRKLQIEFIKETEKDIIKRQKDLEKQKDERVNIIKSERNERMQFEQDKRTQQELLAELRTQENKLKNQLDDQEEKRKKLAAAIRRALEEEIAAASKGNKGFSSTPEGRALSKTFAANKGLLPWPVAKGEITGKFGKVRHPVLKEIWINNNGVDISTPKGSSVRAVFSGKVSKVFVIPGMGKAVMINHGEYRTVYANLKETLVSKGDMVDVKQAIGSLLPDSSGNLSQVHFEIWKVTGSNMNKQNPSYWLSRN